MRGVLPRTQNDPFMYEIAYTTARLARIAAGDSETAKRIFAAYALYGETAHVLTDVEVGFGENAEVAQYESAPPTTGSREELRAWLARLDANTEPFEPGLYEARDRAIDPYLRLLATNDPWRLEGHGSHGRRLSAVTLTAVLTTFDGRIAYAFDAALFVDYVRADVVLAIDPERPSESIRIESLVDVSALHDEELRQIASSYEVVARELALTARFANGLPLLEPYHVTFERASWRAYAAHRRDEPERFLPRADWTSEFPDYGGAR